MAIGPHDPGRGDYNSIVGKLVARALALHEQSAPGKRILIGISGIPGSGKSTLAEAVVSRVNASNSNNDNNNNEAAKPVAAMIPMDGFHLYRSQLAAMPDPEIAIHRRGAAFTFAGDRFADLVRELAEPVTVDSQMVFAPSFDHAKKDPVERDVAIPPTARIIVLEGLYLSLNRKPWSSAAELMDELWFIEVDRDLAQERLIRRHVESGICSDAKAAASRVSSTDMLNADDILENRLSEQERIILPDEKTGLDLS